jgi:hypothetical protein
MFEVNAHCSTMGYTLQVESVRESAHSHAMQALQLYRKACREGLVKKLRRLISRKSNCLLDLNALRPNIQLRGSSYAGLQTVDIHKIQGTEGRCLDFDADFRPLHEGIRQRWLSIATARLENQTLPAISLIQVGALFFVRDGHHRISVARMLGELSIEAEVIAWHTSRPLPWENQPQARRLQAQIS